jgi:hypothetical protein
MEGSQTPHLPWFSSQSRLYQEYISPRVSTNAEGIQDIVEASPMQTKFIESSLLRGRGSTNYFAFHLKGNVDEARLYKVCQALFAKHPIRRTSFVAFKRRLFQVILRSLSPEFYAFECPESQQKQVAVRWVEAHRDEPVSLGQPILHFLFLGGKGESMLVMRFSHAHYDIWGSLIAAAQFADFTRATAWMSPSRRWLSIPTCLRRAYCWPSRCMFPLILVHTLWWMLEQLRGEEES